MHERFGDRRGTWVCEPSRARDEVSSSRGHCGESTCSVIGSFPCRIGRSKEGISANLLLWAKPLIQVQLGSYGRGRSFSWAQSQSSRQSACHGGTSWGDSLWTPTPACASGSCHLSHWYSLIELHELIHGKQSGQSLELLLFISPSCWVLGCSDSANIFWVLTVHCWRESQNIPWNGFSEDLKDSASPPPPRPHLHTHASSQPFGPLPFSWGVTAISSAQSLLLSLLLQRFLTPQHVLPRVRLQVFWVSESPPD